MKIKNREVSPCGRLSMAYQDQRRTCNLKEIDFVLE